MYNFWDLARMMYGMGMFGNAGGNSQWQMPNLNYGWFQNLFRNNSMPTMMYPKFNMKSNMYSGFSPNMLNRNFDVYHNERDGGYGGEMGESFSESREGYGGEVGSDIG